MYCLLQPEKDSCYITASPWLVKIRKCIYHWIVVIASHYSLERTRVFKNPCHEVSHKLNFLWFFLEKQIAVPSIFSNTTQKTMQSTLCRKAQLSAAILSKHLAGQRGRICRTSEVCLYFEGRIPTVKCSLLAHCTSPLHCRSTEQGRLLLVKQRECFQ